ncbi:carboxymuconolactone decarboxylase family protein [Actinomadura verrucosospora]|uniref:Carboxymuconolactone decarboxylase protein n=1 Tax=Actinomadura verrucosospora TaxID=46165 RepID=A0A7D3VX63_ACTVE|nr:carboxymuconolactone decarboxylase family protein [Actinomadura verrucosospora]QKG23094.1 carboxymuconolactone decarboxylase protein [Actinomadura verrucosospora]
MQARMTGLPAIAPDAYKALLNLEGALAKSSVPKSTLELVRLRASQINGCGFCADMHAHDAKKAGETDERLWSVATWREAPYFTDEERAALALTEAATRLADNPGGVPDDVWDEAADNYDEEGLLSLIMCIAAINAWNRINVTTRQIAGAMRA